MSGERLRNLGLTVPVAEVLDPVLWRERYAFGITLGIEQQNLALAHQLCLQRGDTTPSAIAAAQAELGQAIRELPDSTIRWHLRTSLSELELKLGIPFGVVICKADPTGADGSGSAEAALQAEGLVKGVHYDRIVSRRPYTHNEAASWYKLDLPSSVISVERVRAFYYGTLIWEMSTARGNTEQIRVEWRKQGAVHVLPINLQGLVVTQPGSGAGNYGAWHLLASQRAPVPDFWAVDYTLGPVTEQTGEAGRIEAVLADWVYATAGIKILSIGGAAKSQGLASTSTSFDGFSRSVALQASAIYGLNSALENVLGEAVKRIDWKTIKLAKKGIRVRPYGY